MYFTVNVFNIVTLFLVGITIFFAVKRFTLHPDSNWPLAYYGGLVTYWLRNTYTLDNYWVSAGVLCGLLLRFEFLGGAVEKMIRAVELAVFTYVIVKGVKLVLMW